MKKTRKRILLHYKTLNGKKTLFLKQQTLASFGLHQLQRKIPGF